MSGHSGRNETKRGRFDRWGRESRPYDRYVSRASRAIAVDAELRRARDGWLSLVTASHGDPFAGRVDANPDDGSAIDPATTAFLDALYFDHVVDRLLAVAERTFDVTLANPDARDNTDALPVAFRTLHPRIVDVERATRRFERAVDPETLRAAGADDLRSLYESIVPRERRLAFGEYYTPRGVADLAVEAAGIEDPDAVSVLDPGCGSGVFLEACLDRLRATVDGERDTDAVVSALTDGVAGIDLNPVAVRGAKLTYLLALGPVLEHADAERVAVPVFLTDALGLTREDAIRFQGEPYDPTATRLVGNPPWITWDRLPDATKRRWRETYVDRLGLLPHDGIESRLGHANDDVAVPFVWTCIHRYLRTGGIASFVLKRGLTKGPAGATFRRLSVGDRRLDPVHVHDFTDLRPFGDQVAADAAVYTVRADADPSFPVETTSWAASDEDDSRDDDPRDDGDDLPTGGDFTSAAAIRSSLRSESTALVRLDPDAPGSAWVRRDAERAAIGDCAHEIRHGVKDDAEDVFSIDRSTLAELEPDHVYPYLKSRHVVSYGLFGHELRLVPMAKTGADNETALQQRCPRTYDYLTERREALENRSSSWLEGGSFYNVFGLGAYTWADYKVVWCRLGFKPEFAVVSTVDDPDLGTKPVVPGDHFMFVATDDEREAHLLCALLNAAPYRRSMRELTAGGKSGLSKAVVSRLRLPEWRSTPETRRLVELLRRAHRIVPEHTDRSKRAYNATTIPELAAIEGEIDRIVERVLADDASFL